MKYTKILLLKPSPLYKNKYWAYSDTIEKERIIATFKIPFKPLFFWHFLTCCFISGYDIAIPRSEAFKNGRKKERKEMREYHNARK